MKAVFADTAFFLALINSRDRHHQGAAALNANLESPLVTTAWVLLELANALSASRSRVQFKQVLAYRARNRMSKSSLPSQICLSEVASSTLPEPTRNGRSRIASLSWLCASAG